MPCAELNNIAHYNINQRQGENWALPKGQPYVTHCKNIMKLKKRKDTVNFKTHKFGVKNVFFSVL